MKPRDTYISISISITPTRYASPVAVRCAVIRSCILFVCNIRYVQSYMHSQRATLVLKFAIAFHAIMLMARHFSWHREVPCHEHYRHVIRCTGTPLFGNTLYRQECAVLRVSLDLHMSGHATQRNQWPEDVRKRHWVWVTLRWRGCFHLDRRCQHCGVDGETHKRALYVLVYEAVFWMLPVEHAEQ